MFTKSEFIQAVKELPDQGNGLANNEVVALLLILGHEFPKVESPEELAELPVGTLMFDREFRLMLTNEVDDDHLDNEDEVFAQRQPLHVVFVPDDM